jgi:hypothetical protein
MPPTRTVDEVLTECRSRIISSLFIASEGALDPMALTLIAALSPSASFVVFHGSPEPLASLYHQLRHHKLAVNLVLSETWFRDYQVLFIFIRACFP